MEFEKKLIKIKGIAKKTADDIVSAYPTEELLKLAIYNGKNLPFDEDVDKLLRENFKVSKSTAKKFKDYVTIKTTGETLKINRSFNPKIKVVVGPEGTLTTPEAAEFLIKTNPGRIIKGN